MKRSPILLTFVLSVVTVAYFALSTIRSYQQLATPDTGFDDIRRVSAPATAAGPVAGDARQPATRLERVEQDLRRNYLNLLAGFAVVTGLLIWQVLQFWLRQHRLHSENRGLTLQVNAARDLAAELEHRAAHDPLTDLINRAEFERRLRKLVAASRADGSQHAICFIDLDNFKIVNDTGGHQAGDELLCQIARLFEEKVRKHDTVARLGGDEFALLLIDCTLDDAAGIAEQLRLGTEQSRFVWHDKSFNVNATVGVVAVTADADDPSHLMSLADSACYVAKSQGRNRVQVYRRSDQALREQRRHLDWYPRIKQAIDHDRLVLYLQPVAASARPHGPLSHCEVLVRMHGDGETIPPGSFLPAAERCNLSGQIDRWVIRQTLRGLAARPEALARLTLCSINLSGASLSAPRLPDYIRGLLRETGVPPEKICFEITETAAVTALSQATALICDLKRLGCQFALDDFGSGLSSFGYLKKLPVDCIKIDGLFVKDVLADATGHAMVKAINDLGHILGKQTIAEYVESQAVQDALVAMRVDFLQGDHIGRPRPFADLNALTLVGREQRDRATAGSAA